MDTGSFPTVLDFTVEGGAHCTTRWEDGSLVFYPLGWWMGSKQLIQLPEERWRSFQALLDDLGTWEWQGNFGKHVMCGTPWTLRLEWAGRSINCSGNSWLANAVPQNFRGFVVGLAALIGLPDTHLTRWAADQ
jgi:hypothetical protein